MSTRVSVNFVKTSEKPISECPYFAELDRNGRVARNRSDQKVDNAASVVTYFFAEFGYLAGFAVFLSERKRE